MPQQTLTCGNIDVCVNEAAGGGVIIAGLQIIQLRFGIKIISTVTQGVDLADRICQRAGNGKELTVGIVLVGSHSSTVGVNQAENITLQIGDVVVGSGSFSGGIDQGVGVAGIAIQEIQSNIAIGFPQELAAGVEIVVGYAVYGLAQAQAVAIIGVSIGICSLCGADEVAALSPGKGITAAVVVAQRVAGAVIGNGLAVESRQQISPVGIAVGIGVAGGAVGSGKDIAAQVVGVGPGLAAARSGKQLVQVIVGIGVGGAVSGIGKDIAQNVVGIAIAGSAGKAGVGKAAYLGGSLTVVNIPVGIGLGIDIPGGDGGQPAQEIVAQAYRLAQGLGKQYLALSQKLANSSKTFSV